MKSELKSWMLKHVAVKAFQPFFETMHWIALKGMNYGSANNPRDSGEAALLDLITPGLPNQPVVFDVGANVGQYIDLLLEKMRHDGVVIHAFEPDAKSFERLVDRYGSSIDIKLVNEALGESPSTSVLYFEDLADVKASLVKPLKGAWKSCEVKVNTLDQYCFDKGISHIDLLKIDVEGFELEVLRGARDMINNEAIDHIQLEHGSLNSISVGASIYKFRSMLNNYDVFHLKQDGVRKMEYMPRFEIFYNSNYYFRRRNI